MMLKAGATRSAGGLLSSCARAALLFAPFAIPMLGITLPCSSQAQTTLGNSATTVDLSATAAVQEIHS